MRDVYSMFRRLYRGTAYLGLVAAIGLDRESQGCGPPPSPMQQAIDYLVVEVPRWRRENACYSCHNNGDAVRALAVATRHGLLGNHAPLDDTVEFLRAPEEWDANGPEGPFKDVKLARIQFAAALDQLTAQGVVTDREPLLRAAALVADLQATDGSWPSDVEGTVGSPVTYGQPLATAIALRTLRDADATRFAEQIQLGTQWFERREIHNTLDAAAVLLALNKSPAVESRQRCTQALKLLAGGESASGGWGPFVNSPPEVFDTAVVLISLEAVRGQHSRRDELVGQTQRGRKFLLDRQNPDGSWPATTRPPGVDSYAQQISTTGWAVQALLATSGKAPANATSRPALDED